MQLVTPFQHGRIKTAVIERTELMNLGRWIFIVCVSLWIAAGSGLAAERNPVHYVGVTTCGMCHKQGKTGDQVAKWQAGPHSRAFELLGTPEAKAIAAKLGVADPKSSGKCLKCHATAYHWTEQVQTQKVRLEDGVVCESCHGPGEAYISKTDIEITLSKNPLHLFTAPAKTCISHLRMEERNKAIAAGLIYPATQSCTRCHNEQSPAWKPDRYTTQDGRKVGFDIAQSATRIAHARPQTGK
ncbi:MAG: hypothetical protein FJ388_02930 [Verrucomicrobia bacterium]|nr:hypothetical protein [Verrucomicrobiota bacterium]